MKLRSLSYLLAGAVLFKGASVSASAGTDAALGGLNTSATGAGLNQGNIDAPAAIGNILGIVLSFTGIIFFILIVYAGLMWMTAAGNDEQIKKAQGIIKAAVIGLIIIMSAYAITRFIGSAIQS